MIKKKLQIMAVIAILLSLALVITTISCPALIDDEDKPTALNGTWESSGGQKITFSGSSFTRITGGALDYKGTFRLYDDGEIVFTINQYSIEGGNKWLSLTQYIDAAIIADIGESAWNNMTAEEKQSKRDQVYNTAPTSQTGEWRAIFAGKHRQFVIIYPGYPSNETIVYQKAGTSTVSDALLGKWVDENAPTVVVLDFSITQMKLIRGSITNTYYTLETEGKIEIGTNPGTFTNDFCTSYTITGGTLTFTGGQSEIWYPSVSFKKYVLPPYPPTPLTADQWADGAITVQAGEAWYSFSVTRGTTYRLWWSQQPPPKAVA